MERRKEINYYVGKDYSLDEICRIFARMLKDEDIMNSYEGFIKGINVEDITYYEPTLGDEFYPRNGFLRCVERKDLTFNKGISYFVDHKKNGSPAQKFRLAKRPTEHELVKNFGIKSPIYSIMHLKSNNHHFYFMPADLRVDEKGPYMDFVVQYVTIDDVNGPKEIIVYSLRDRTADKYGPEVAKLFDDEVNRIFNVFVEFMSNNIAERIPDSYTHYDIYSSQCSCTNSLLPF